MQHGPPHAVWGCLDFGWRDNSGYWVHPAAADAAIHSAAIGSTEPQTLTAVGLYAPTNKLEKGNFLLPSFTYLVPAQ